jgi:hypothetical protein
MRPIREIAWFVGTTMSVGLLLSAASLSAQQVCVDPVFRADFADGVSSRYRVLRADTVRSRHNAIDTSLDVALDSLNRAGPGAGPLQIQYRVTLDCARWADTSAVVIPPDTLPTDSIPDPDPDPVGRDTVLVADAGANVLVTFAMDATGDTLYVFDIRLTTGGQWTDPGTSPPEPARFRSPTTFTVPKRESAQTLSAQAYVVGVPGGPHYVQTITISADAPDPTVARVDVLPASFTVYLPDSTGVVPDTLREFQPVWAVIYEPNDARPYLCEADGSLHEALLFGSPTDSVTVRTTGGNVIQKTPACTVDWCVDDPAVLRLVVDGQEQPACGGGGGTNGSSLAYMLRRNP